MAQRQTDQLKTRLKNAERLRKLLMELPEPCFDYFIAIEPNTALSTRIGYARDLRIFFDYLCEHVDGFTGRSPSSLTIHDIAGVTSQHIEHYLSYLNLYAGRPAQDGAQPTIHENDNPGKKRKLSALRSFFRYLNKRGLLPHNAAATLDTPRIKEKPIIRLEAAEVSRLLDAVEDGSALETDKQRAFHEKTRVRDTALITLMLGTGIRLSECVGMNLADVDMENRSFRITRKGGKQAVLYMSDEVAEALAAYMDKRSHMNPAAGHEQALFLSLQNKRITARAVENIVKKYTKAVVPLKRITPHKLRSTYGTALYQSTRDIYLVADVLGHQDVNTTRRHYAQMQDENRRAAADALRLRRGKGKKH